MQDGSAEEKENRGKQKTGYRFKQMERCSSGNRINLWKKRRNETLLFREMIYLLSANIDNILSR
jgi:hypothetical protein